MIPAGTGIEYRRLRAPREHGGVLADPPLGAAGEWLQRNRSLPSLDSDCQGRPLQELALEARRALWELARAYTGRYADVPGPESLDLARPVVVTGHQPHLFHPGVWFKNFALDAVADAAHATPINLLIDNDTLRSPTLKVPCGSADEPRVDVVPFDRQQEEIPFEERRVVDETLFATFGERVSQRLAGLISQPLIETVWPAAQRARRLERERPIGLCLAQARHELERSWGLRTLETPLSAWCETWPFRWFAAHLLAQLPRFRQVYNQALAEYRQVHGIRSRSHPVPELEAEGEWLEAPLWIWSAAEPRRRRLFARQVAGRVELTDRQGRRLSLDLDAERTAEGAVEQLAEWSRDGVRLRPRALITTLFVRLLASDLFLHGIGGAKYDQLTDALARRFFGVTPPSFLTVTMTAQLPIPHPVATRDDVRQANRWLRELRYHPERFTGGGDLSRVPPSVDRLAAPDADSNAASAELESLVAAKREWLARRELAELATRHRELTRINRTLAEQLDARRAAIETYREHVAVLAARHALLASREYSFCLYGEQALRPLLLDRASAARVAATI